METQQQWRTFCGKHIKNTLSDEVKFILQHEQNQEQQVQVCIGTDSQVKGACTEFATVIVFVRPGQGGFMLINKEKSYRTFTLKERMMQEVSKSISVAYELMEVTKQMNVQVEIHADINTAAEHKSHIALSDAKGFITGMGFLFKAKPYAFASSSCANRIVQ